MWNLMPRYLTDEIPTDNGAWLDQFVGINYVCARQMHETLIVSFKGLAANAANAANAADATKAANAATIANAATVAA